MKDLSKGDKVQEFWSEYECVGGENVGGKRGEAAAQNWRDKVDRFGSL